MAIQMTKMLSKLRETGIFFQKTIKTAQRLAAWSPILVCVRPRQVFALSLSPSVAKSRSAPALTRNLPLYLMIAQSQ